MILALYLKFPFILDRNLAKANCTENQVCTSCDIIVLDIHIKIFEYKPDIVKQHILCPPLANYASPSSGEAYRDRQLTTNFEL